MFHINISTATEASPANHLIKSLINKSKWHRWGRHQHKQTPFFVFIHLSCNAGACHSLFSHLCSRCQAWFWFLCPKCHSNCFCDDETYTLCQTLRNLSQTKEAALFSKLTSMRRLLFGDATMCEQSAFVANDSASTLNWLLKLFGIQAAVERKIREMIYFLFCVSLLVKLQQKKSYIFFSFFILEDKKKTIELCDENYKRKLPQ